MMSPWKVTMHPHGAVDSSRSNLSIARLQLRRVHRRRRGRVERVDRVERSAGRRGRELTILTPVAAHAAAHLTQSAPLARRETVELEAVTVVVVPAEAHARRVSGS